MEFFSFFAWTCLYCGLLWLFLIFHRCFADCKRMQLMLFPLCDPIIFILPTCLISFPSYSVNIVPLLSHMPVFRYPFFMFSGKIFLYILSGRMLLCAPVFSFYFKFIFVGLLCIRFFIWSVVCSLFLLYSFSVISCHWMLCR